MIIDGITTPSGTVIDTNELDALDSSVPKGAVLQVVNGLNGTEVDLGLLANDSFYIGMTASITPLFTSSKILVIASTMVKVNNGNFPALITKITRNGTSMATHQLVGYLAAVGGDRRFEDTFNFLDIPNTTSELVYNYEGMNTSGSSASGTYDGKLNSDGSTGSITLMEIAQ